MMMLVSMAMTLPIKPVQVAQWWVRGHLQPVCVWRRRVSLSPEPDFARGSSSLFLVHVVLQRFAQLPVLQLPVFNVARLHSLRVDLRRDKPLPRWVRRAGTVLCGQVLSFGLHPLLQ